VTLKTGLGSVKVIENVTIRWETGLRKTFDDIFSRLGTMHQRDRRADSRTDTGDSKDGAYA